MKRSLWILAVVLTILVGCTKEDVKVLDRYALDSTLFIQGLDRYDDEKLLLSTGLNGKSSIGTYDFEHYVARDVLPRTQFGEGSTVTPNGIIQLTWKAGVAYLRDTETFELKDQFTYEGEGWGIDYDTSADILYMTDGSHMLQVRNAKTFEQEKEIAVTEDGKSVEKLNEIETAKGYVYANVWYEDRIIKIDPKTGEVVASYDFTDVLKEELKDYSGEIDVLNGISYDEEDDVFYVTGKYYPYVWKVKIE